MEKKPRSSYHGNSQSIIMELGRYVKLGVNYFTIHFADIPDIRSLDLFATDVIPVSDSG